MPTLLSFTITTLEGHAIKGLNVKAFSLKQEVGEQKKDGILSFNKKDQALIETHNNAKLYLKIYEGDRLIKTTESEKMTGLLEGKKEAFPVIKIRGSKLSFAKLPKENQLYKTLSGEMEKKAIDLQFQKILSLRETIKTDQKKAALKKAIAKEVSSSSFLESHKKKFSEFTLKTLKALKSNKKLAKELEGIELDTIGGEDREIAEVFRLEEPIEQNNQFKELLKEKYLKEAATALKLRDKAKFLQILKTNTAGQKELVDELIKAGAITDDKREDLELWLDVQPLIGNSSVLLKAVVANNKITTSRDLVTLRSKKLATILSKEEDLPISGDQQTYINVLEDRIASRFPYAFMMDRLSKGDFAKEKEAKTNAERYLKKSDATAKLKAFYEKFQDLDLRAIDFLAPEMKVKIEGIEKTENWGDKKGKIENPVRQQLMAMQRVFKIAPTYHVAATMFKAGLYAASEVTSLPLYELTNRIRKFEGTTNVPEKSIRSLKARAERVVSQAMHFVANTHSLISNDHFGINVDVTTAPQKQPNIQTMSRNIGADGAGSGNPTTGNNSLKEQLKKQLAQIPGYEDHFGPQNYCKCAHCQSIYSPGAYFVDLMQYAKWGIDYYENDVLLDHSDAATQNSLLHLSSRRKELWEIPLTCENAHKEIPYLEVMNKVLETYIKSSLFENTSVSLFLYPSANVISKHSNFSFAQPTNYYFETLKVLLGHFDLTPFDLLFNKNTFDEHQARYFLGITLSEWEVITAENPENNIRYGEVLDAEEVHVVAFLKKTGISRKELQYLLKTNAISKKGAPKVKAKPIGDNINKYEEKIINFKEKAADLFFRFVRLEKLLPWTIQELDLAIGESGIIDNDKLVEIAKMAYIQKELEVSTEELIGILSGIPTKSGVQIKTYRQQYTDLEFEQAAPSLLYRLFKPIEEDLAITEETNAPELARAINEHFEDFYHPALDTRPEDEKSTVSEKLASLLGVLKISETAFSFLLLELAKKKVAEEVYEIVITDNVKAVITNGIFDFEPDTSKFLDLINLLYRYVKIADGLGLSVQELVYLTKLVLAEGQKIRSIDDVIQLIQGYKVIEDLPFSLEELTYATQDTAIDSSFYSFTEEQIQQAFEKTKEGIINQQIDINKFIEVFISSSTGNQEEKENGVKALQIVFEELVDDKHLIFDTQTKVYYSTNDDNNEIDALTFPDFPEAGDLLKKEMIAKHNILFTFLSNIFNVAYQKVSQALLFIEENAVTNPTIHPLSEDILSVIQSLSSDAQEINLSVGLERVFKQLNQTLFIFKKFNFDEAHISQIIEAAEKLGMTEMGGRSTRIENLPQRVVVQHLHEYKKWVELTENTSYNLPEWLSSISTYNGTEEPAKSLASLLEITPRQLIEIRNIIKPEGDNSPFIIDNFQQLRLIAQRINLLGISIADLEVLTKLGNETFEGDDQNSWFELFEFLSRQKNIKQANKAILNAFKSKYKTEAEWEEAYEPYQEKLLEIKRDVLVDYILNWRNHPENRDAKYCNFEDVNDLYHYFLLDPAMSGCARVSQIKAATLSLQLYIQRVFLQLEKSGDGTFYAQMNADLAPQWIWRKNYRIWEANRKVFLYPENYIEPEWRDNKSPQFEKLEEELMQEEINADSVELAYKLYLNQFVEVANLTIAGQYYDDRDGNGIYYFFGRTVTEPYLYYYRKFIPQTETRAEEWTAWERIDLPINSMEVTAIHYLGKLYLFWKEKRSIKNQAGQDLIKYILVYSKQLSNGVWMKPNILGGNKNFAECWDMKASLPFFSINPSTNKIEFENDLSVDTQPVSIPLPETPNFQLDPLLIWASIDEVDFSLNSTRSSLEKEFKYIISQADYRYNVDDLFIYIKNDKLLFSQNIFNSFISSGNTYYNAQVAKYFNTNHSSTAVNNSIEVGDLSNRYEYEQQLKLNLFSNSPAHLLKIGTEAYILFPSTGYKSRLAREYYLDGSYEYTVVNQEWHNIKIKKADTTISNNLDQRFHTNKLSEFLSYNTQERLKESPVTYFSHPSDDDYSVAGSGGPYSLLSKPQIPNHLYYNGPYGTYFKELFFHIPFLIANHLNANQKFKEAKWWYERIFNPTPTAESGTPGTEHFWEFLPFRKVAKAGVASLKSMLQNTQSIGAYEEEPFMPHMIARVRTDAYMKAIVMKYIDNLLDWGDQLFSRDSFESINEAMMLYILAQDILGGKPVELGECEAVATQTYEDIEKKLVAGKEDDFLIYLENQLSVTEAPPTEEAGGVSADEIDQSTVTDIPQYLPLFCVPFNKDMLAYWNRVEDRLFKIRNCMNIKGQKRKLSLYEPPIDPRLLVAARASGLSLEDAIASVLGAGNLPHYRFNTILSKARDYVGTVQSFGSALLSAVEKKDVEQLTLLRSTHEQNILKLTKLIKKSQIEEAQTQLDNLQETKANVQLRVDYYEVLIEEGLISWEKAQQNSAHVGNIIKIGAGIADILPIGLHMVPKAFTTTGGEEAAKAAEAGAKVIHTLSSIAHAASSSFGIEAGNQRRKQEWKQQLKVAQQELKQVDQQILAAEIRIQINEQDLVVYEQQVEQAKELHDFYKNKLTKLGLYNYHATTLGRLFRHAYNMALDMAKQAERCYQFEVDDPTNYIIQNDNWDSSHYGFLAGERLLFQLQQLDKAYLEKNERRQEITQSFSLRQLDAMALLQLKATGNSEGFIIPEWVFDMFYPGHYKRIIKSVRLTIPCVTGPYTNVPATLTLNGSEIRLKADWKNEPTGRSYGKMQSISTSSANNDGGLFEFNFRDERYLPFEGAGAANSKWSLSLPSQYRPFDYNTISDVIIHISYTSKFDGVPVGDDYDSFVAQRITDAIGTKYLLISLKHDFPNEYTQLMGGDDATLTIGQTHFPYFAMGQTIEVAKSEMHRVDKDTVLINGKPLEFTPISNNPLELKITISRDDFVKEDKAIFILLEYTLEKR